MPIYEYRCQSCDKVLEVLVRGGKEPEVCTEPNCQGHLVRKMSRAGVIFKGSGFYVTDSRSSNSASEKKSDASSTGSEKKSDSSSTSDSGSASDSKPKNDSSSTSDSKSTASSTTSTGKSDSSPKSSD